MSPLGLTVTADGRDGSLSLAKAYNGSNRQLYIHTPVEFYGNTMWVSRDMLMLPCYLLLFYSLLFAQLRHCRVRGVANEWLSSYLENRLQYI